MARNLNSARRGQRIVSIFGLLYRCESVVLQMSNFRKPATKIWISGDKRERGCMRKATSGNQTGTCLSYVSLTGHSHLDQVASCTGRLLRWGTELDSVVWKWQLDCRSTHDGKYFDLVCTIRLL